MVPPDITHESALDTRVPVGSTMLPPTITVPDGPVTDCMFSRCSPFVKAALMMSTILVGASLHPGPAAGTGPVAGAAVPVDGGVVSGMGDMCGMSLAPAPEIDVGVVAAFVPD